MRPSSLPILSTLLLAGFVTAQAGPGKLSTEQGNNRFTVNSSATGNIPLTSLTQISHNQLPGNAAGIFTTCATGSGLTAAAGGVGGSDVWIGVWDSNTGKMTSTQQAAALNSTGTEFGLMLDPTGRYAVFDRSSGPQFSVRPAPGLPFPAPVPILDAGTATTWSGGAYVDPSLGLVGGKLKLFYLSGADILMDDFDISNPKTPRLGGNPVKVASSTTASSPNSPTPIHGADKDVEGLWMANLVGSDNDMVFSADLNPKTPWVMTVDTTNWINNGGVAGGLLTYANTGWAYDVEVAWLLGDTEKPGGMADITGAVHLAPKQIASTIVLMSIGESKPLTIPGFMGQFGLNLSVLMPLGSMVHKDATHLGALSFQIPSDKTLSGVSVALQGLSINNMTKKVVFTNTTFLSIL